ncbi:hypothetical protein HS088_TW18G00545 [Tripterygium wilfordii]|uniref:Uncharacterized protein n=1 Tax=Tripterygium wilfordii TaxID=458696 RepID=A0A7J7CCP6_TRIWF|nr:protein SOB FIVE-LIKE 6-like [Tripterygium wilfordii]KAF5731860.1 hypothetical protein HS088_TW18G00545 [Tripterygium wilfordii]
MNVLASECSSGESGWTFYLEQSFLSPNNQFVDAKSGFCHDFDDQQRGRRNRLCVEGAAEEEEEEDLSMVSDASSGPPHVNEDDSGCFYNSFKAPTLSSNGGKKKQKMKERRRIDHNQEPPSSYNLDDTASSPAFNFSKSNFGVTNNNQASMESVLDYSQGFSATHFEGRSAYQDHQYGFTNPSWSGNQLHHNNQWF